MPAPTYTDFYNAIESYLKQEGLTKKEFKTNVNGEIIYDDDGNPIIEDSGELTDDMKKIVRSISNGIVQVWQQWQTNQVVQVDQVTLVQPGAGVSGPGTGSLP